jgi:hypothetical protein
MRVNPDTPAHKSAAQLKALEEIKNKVAEYEKNPPFDQNNLYLRYFFVSHHCQLPLSLH